MLLLFKQKSMNRREQSENGMQNGKKLRCNRLKQGVVVSVDGPSASGKSTVSRGVAERLGFTYCDSGSLYRAVTWKALREDLDIEDEELVLEMLEEMEWDFFEDGKAMAFTIDGINPGNQIRSAQVAEHVSTI